MIKHNSAGLLYVVLLYNKTMWVHKTLLLIRSLKTVMGGSIFKMTWKTAP